MQVEKQKPDPLVNPDSRLSAQLLLKMHLLSDSLNGFEQGIRSAAANTKGRKKPFRECLQSWASPFF